MSEEYSNHILQLTIAKLLTDIGFKSVQNIPLHQLSEQLKKFIIKIGIETKIVAEMENCSEPDIMHVEQAFRRLNISLDDLDQYTTQFSNNSDRMLVPAYPIRKENSLNFLKPGSGENVTRPLHIFNYLPSTANLPTLCIPKLEKTDDQEEEASGSLAIGKPRNLESAFMTSSGFISPATQGMDAELANPIKRKRESSTEESIPDENAKKARCSEQGGNMMDAQESDNKIGAQVQLFSWKTCNKIRGTIKIGQIDTEPTDNPKRVRFAISDTAVPCCSYSCMRRPSPTPAPPEESSSESDNEGISSTDTSSINSDKTDSDSPVISSEEGDKKTEKSASDLAEDKPKLGKRKRYSEGFIIALKRYKNESARNMRISVSEDRIQEIKESNNNLLNYTDSNGFTVHICPACACLEDLGPMIFCDKCHNWFHFDCVDLAEAPQESLWYCAECFDFSERF